MDTDWKCEWNRLGYLQGKALTIAIDDVKLLLLEQTAKRLEAEGLAGKTADPESAMLLIECEAYCELASNLRDLAKGIEQHKLGYIGQFDSAVTPGTLVPDAQIDDEGKIHRA